MASDVRVGDVMRALYQDCDGVIEFRVFPEPGARLFAPLEDIERIRHFWQQHHDRNLYWGVATRRNDLDGSLLNCLHLPALFADCDFKLASESAVRDRLAACPLHPSLIINSGNGLHPYWFLREPADVQADAHALRDVLRRLASWLGADLAVGEPARVLRVPGTTNVKGAIPKVVFVETFAPDRQYNPSDFDWLPSMPQTGVSQSIDLSKPIGFLRNQTLYKLGRALKGKRLPDVVVVATIRTVNAECCAPPLDETEMQQIIRNVVSQPDRPRPTASRTRVEVAADVQ